MFRIASKRLRRTFWQEGRFHLPTSAEMMKHGYAMLTGLPLDVADRAVLAMLKLYEREYIDAPKVGQ